MKTGKYKEIGDRCRAVRNHLKMTLKEVNNETGISRGYISDFERGRKLPTAKYLKHLSEKHNVSLDYIFKGHGKLIKHGTWWPDGFDIMTGKCEVDEMLHYMLNIKHAYFAMMMSFSKYKMVNEKLIEKRLAKMDKKLTEPTG